MDSSTEREKSDAANSEPILDAAQCLKVSAIQHAINYIRHLTEHGYVPQMTREEGIGLIQRLRREPADWRKLCIVEIASENASVAEYVEHWEGRALKAEAALDSSGVRELREALEAFMNACVVPKQDMQAEKNAISHAYQLGQKALLAHSKEGK